MKEIRYRLYFTDDRQAPLTLVGSRRLASGDPRRMWHEATVLHARVVRGHRTPADERFGRVPDGAVAEAVLRLGAAYLLRQLTSLRVSCSLPAAGAAGLARLGAMIFGKLWDVYARPVLTWSPF